MLGQEIAQLATRFGANDLDGTIIEEKISRMAGGRSGMVMGKNELEDLIRKAESTPVERDTLYNVRNPEDLRQGGSSESVDVDVPRLRSIQNNLHYEKQVSLEDIVYAANHSTIHEKELDYYYLILPHRYRV